MVQAPPLVVTDQQLDEIERMIVQSSLLTRLAVFNVAGPGGKPLTAPIAIIREIAHSVNRGSGPFYGVCKIITRDQEPDEHVIVAWTGNGPASRTYAEFYANAVDNLITLVQAHRFAKRQLRAYDEVSHRFGKILELAGKSDVEGVTAAINQLVADYGQSAVPDSPNEVIPAETAGD